MGGRGGSRGSGSGGGGSSAVNAKMPELSGSEKQVSWAQSIRENALENADLLVKNAKKLGLNPSAVTASVEGAEAARKVVINSFQSETKASVIIDRRRSTTYQAIEKIALAYDAQKRSKRRS